MLIWLAIISAGSKKFIIIIYICNLQTPYQLILYENLLRIFSKFNGPFINAKSQGMKYLKFAAVCYI